MNSRLFLTTTLTLLLISSPAFADLFVTPYGSFTNFSNFTTSHTLDINASEFVAGSVEASQLDRAFGGGIVLGSSSESSGLVFGLNVEILGGTENFTYLVGNSEVGDRSIESTAISAGLFIGARVSGLSKGNFQTVMGIEMGALKPSGTITLRYLEAGASDGDFTEEQQDFGETSILHSALS